ncbi:hypothetical protein [Orientia tsutsugamushi]
MEKFWANMKMWIRNARLG